MYNVYLWKYYISCKKTWSGLFVFSNRSVFLNYQNDFERSQKIKRLLHVYFLLAMECYFNKLLYCRRTYKFVGVACLAMQHLLKSCRNVENSEYSGNLSISKFCCCTVWSGDIFSARWQRNNFCKLHCNRG